MAGERLHFLFLHGGGVYVQAGHDLATELITEPMRHGVVDGYFVIGRAKRWRSGEIGHAAGEGGGDGETAGVRVIFHVVQRGMSEDDIGLRFSDGGGYLAEERGFVENFQIVRQTRAVMGAQNLRGEAGFFCADHFGAGPVVAHAATVPIGYVEIMDFVANGLKEQESAGHGKLDIIRVGGNRQR